MARRGMLSRAVLMTAAALLPAGLFAEPAATALPQGGVVKAGVAAIAQPAPGKMVITQQGDRAIINWDSFNIGREAAVEFRQPTASSATLNRVLGSDPSAIFGQLTANGTILLLNPHGVLFGPTARVDVGSLVVSTHALADEDFLAGRLTLTRAGAMGAIVNEGEIRAKLGGYIALLAPEVRNAGLIVAEAGTVALAAGEVISLNFDPTGALTQLFVTPSQVAALVENRQAVLAPGGRILVSAQGFNALSAGVIRNAGTLDAGAVVHTGGRVLLEASAAVEVSGAVRVASEQGPGGSVTVTGTAIALQDGAMLDASGATGGGEILVGGGWQGGGGLRAATTVTMAAGATMDVSARQTGTGGTAVLWSAVDNPAGQTTASGLIRAQGGVLGGDGGRVETSGYTLFTDGIRVDTQATAGRTGLWLLDPVNITIADSGGNLTPTQLRDGLLTSNVSISTAGSGSASGVSPSYSAGAGVITISSPLTSLSANALTLTADTQINFNAAVSLGGSLTLNAGSLVTVNAALTMSAGDVVVAATGFAGTGALTLASGSTLRITQSADSNYAGVIAGAGALTKAGAGAFALTGANNFTGNITVNAGTLRIGGAGNLTAGTYVGAITVATGATFDFASSANQIFGTAVLSGNVTNDTTNTLRGAGAYAFGGSGAVTLRGDFSATGTVTVGGALTMTGGTNNANAGFGRTSTIEILNGGTITLAGVANSFIGQTVTSALTLRAGGKLTTDGTAGQTFHLGTINFDGGELATGAGATNTIWGLYNLDKTVTVTDDSTISAQFNSMWQGGGTVFNVAAGKTLTVSGTLILPSVQADTGLVVNAAAGSTGTLLLTGVNTYTGATTITRGTLRIGGAGLLGNGAYASTISNAGAFAVATSASQTFSGVISGAGTLTQAGAGTTTLTATNTYTGATTVSAGVLQVGSGGTAGTLAAASAVSIASGATLRFFRADLSPTMLTVANAISGDGTLEFRSTGGNGLGQFNLTGTNTLSSSAVILVNQARLQVDAQVNLSTSLPLIRVLTGGQLYINRTGTIANPLELGAGLGWKETDATQLGMIHVPSWGAAGPVSFTGDVTLTGNSSVAAWGANGSNITMSGIISDGGNGFGFTKLGVLKLTLTGANTFTGTTTISAGTLQVGAAGTTGVIVGPIVNNSALIFDRSDTLAFAGAISGTGTLAKPGTNTLTLTGLSTYAGATSVTAGGIIFRRDVAPSTAGFAGAGAVTIEPTAASFTSALSPGYSFASTLTGLTIGKSGNTAALTIPTSLSIAGPISLFGGDVTLTGGLAATAAGDILVRASGALTIAATRTITSSNGDVTLTAGRFVNNSGASALSAGGTGKTWRVWSTNADPYHVSTGDVLGSLAFDYRQYVATYGTSTVQGTGKGLLYSFAPTLVSSFSTTPTKVYDRTDAAAVTNAMVTTASGLAGGDLTPVFTFSAATYASRNAGNAQVITFASAPTVLGQSSVATGSKPVYGYLYSGLSAPTGNITPLALTVSGAAAANKVYDRLLGAVVSGGIVTGLSGDTVTVNASAAAGAFANKNVGTTKAVTVTGYVLGGADAANYSVIQPTGITANITALSLALTGITAANKTYDRLLTATLSGGSIAVISGDTVNLVTTGKSGAFADKNVGDAKAVTVSGYTISGTDAANYSLVQPTDVTANITALSLAITGATAANRVYDQGVTATISGGAITIISGDTVTLNSSGRTGVFANKNVGTAKAVTVTGYTISGTDATNYALVQPTGVTANIAALSLAITGATAANKTYDALLGATISGGTISIISGDTVSLVTAGRTGVFGDKNVSTTKAVTVTGYVLGGADAANYSVIQPTGITANITALSLALTGITAANKTYDRLLTATLSGGSIAVISGDTVDLVTTGKSGAFADKNVGDAKAVTISGYTISGTDAANYSLVQPTDVTANITALSLAVTGATAANRVYDQGVTATISGGAITIISGDTATLDDSGRAGVFANKNVGTAKVVTASGYTISGADAGNYALTQPTGVTANIMALSLAVTGATAANKTYDALLGATISGGSIAPISGDTVTLVDTGLAGVFATKNVGTTKAITVSGYTISGADAANYALAQPSSVTADITAKTLSLSATKVYDGSVDLTGAVSIVTGVGSETLTYTGATATNSHVATSSKTFATITLVNATDGSGGLAVNYQLPDLDAAHAPVTVTARTLTFSLTNAGVTKVYDATANAPSGFTPAYSIAGYIGGDTAASLGYDAVSYNSANVASATTLTVSGLGMTAVTGSNASQATDYVLAATSKSVAATITKAPLTVRANDDVRFIGQADTVNYRGVSYTGFQGADTDAAVTGSIAVTRAGSDINAGAYAGVLSPDPSLLSAANYRFITATGDYTIVPANQLLVKVQDVTSTYGGTPSYVIISAQYLASDNSTIASLSTVANGSGFTADGVQFTVAPVVPNQLSGAGNVPVGSHALTGSVTAGTSSNFSNTFVVVGTLAVVRKPITASASNVSKVYDGTTNVAGVTMALGGLVTNDVVTVSGLGAFSSRSAGTGLSYVVSNLTLSGADAANYYLSGGASLNGTNGVITAKPLTANYVASQKVYDGAAGASVTGSTTGTLAGDTLTLTQSASFADRHVGDAKTVSISGITLGGADASNYALTSTIATATADITPLTLAISGVTAANKTYNRLLTATLSGGSIAVISGDTVNLETTGKSGAFADKNVGDAKAVTVSGYTISGTDAANYSLVQPTGVTADITQLTLAISGVTAANRVYDQGVTATISGGAITIIAGDTVTLDDSGKVGVFANKNVGTGKAVTVSGYTISGADAANYSLVQPASVTANITALSLAITGATVANKTYDALTAATISGGVITVISGDTVSLVATGKSGVFADKNIGLGKAVSVSGYTLTGADAANYVLIQPAGLTANITALSLIVTGAMATSRVYDQGVAATISGGAISVISGDTVTLDTSSRVGSFANKNVGTGKVVTVAGFTVSGTDAANYALVQPTGVTADISALTLNVTGATATHRVYDQGVSAMITGGAVTIISGDDITLDSSSRAGVFADKNVGTAKVVTVSGYAISGADAGNYALAQPTGVTANITTLSLAVTGATAANKVYDRLLTAGISGGVIAQISGDIVTLDDSGRTGVFATKTVGASKAVTVSGYTIAGADAANYALVQPTGVTADITALSLTVTGATAANKAYDALLGATISGGSIGAISGDTVSLVTTSRTGVFANKNVGTTKAVTVSGYTISGADAANYSLVQPTGVTADIAALSLAVTGATAAHRVYDQGVTATISGGAVTMISGDDVTLDNSNRTGVFADKNVGLGKGVTVSGYTISGADAGNYALTQPAGVTANITALSLAVTGATAANKTYDALLGVTISGGSIAPISGDTVLFSILDRTGVFGDKNVGTGKAVTVSGYVISGTDAANYSLIQPTGLTADIALLSLAVTGSTAANKTYDALLGAMISGGSIAPISGDTVSLATSGRTGIFGDKNVGSTKAVTVSGYTLSGTDAANYALVQPSGIIADITALSLAVTGATAANKTYDALLGVTISGGSIAPISGDTVLFSILGRTGVFGDKNVGTSKAVTVSGYTISGTDAGNYTLVQPTGVTADIAALSLAVAGTTAANKTYDALLGATISGGSIAAISGDMVSLVTTSRTGVFANKNVGTTKAVTISGYTLSGTDADNYSLAQPTGITADITVLSLAVTGATAASRVYDAGVAAVISGGAIAIISGDLVSLVDTNRTGVFANKNVGTAKAVTATGYTLSGTDAANYSLVQPASVTADITALSLAITGATAADKTYDRSLSATLSGGSIAAIVNDSVTLDGSAKVGVFADGNVGTTKAITVSGYTLTGIDATNYSLVQPTSLTADITALALVVTGATAANKVYDRTVTAVVTGGVVTALAGDTATLDVTNRAGVFGDALVGAAKAITVSGYALGGAQAGNYILVQPTDVTASITARTLNITGTTAANKTYDVLTSAVLTGGVIAIISGDDVTLVDTNRAGVFASKHVGAGKAVTVSGYTLSGGDVANYTLVQPTGVTADITALSLTITGASAASRVYNQGVAVAIAGGAITKLSGDDVSLVTAGQAGIFANKNVGTTKAVTVSGYTLTGTDAPNYSLVQPTGITADITALSLAITGATATSRVYDAGVAATISGGAISIISGDDVSLVTAGQAGVFANKNVGMAKAVTVSGYTLSGNDALNYALVQPIGITADITQLSLAITGATAASRVYDAGVAAAITGGTISIISGDIVSLIATGQAGVFGDKNVGTAKAITVSGYTLFGADADNYALVQPTGITANITALTLAVTGATAANKTYDRLLTAAVSGGAVTVLGGDTVLLDGSLGTGVFADKNVGNTKAVTVSGYTISGADAANYALVQPTAVTADITQLTLNLTGVVAADKVYDRGLGATLTGGTVAPIASDDVSVLASGRSGVFADKNVGTGKAVTVSGYTLSGADAANYALVQPSGVTAAITQLSLDLTGVTAASRTYDRGVVADLSGGSVNPLMGDVVTVDDSGRAGAFADKNVGTTKAVTVSGYTLAGADAANYVLVQPTGVTANITQLSLNLTGVTAADKTYDRLLTAAVSGGAVSALAGDDVTVVDTNRAGLFAGKDVGTAKVVTVTGYTISGADTANYALVQPTGVSATITARSLAVTGATITSRVYDQGVTAAINGGVIAQLSGDTVSLISSGLSGSFTDKNVGTGKAVTVSGYTLAGTDAGNYALLQPSGVRGDITARLLTPTFAATTRAYDGTTAITVQTGDDRVGADVLSLSFTATLADKHAGSGKPVTITGLVLGGADAANYALAGGTATTTAQITRLASVAWIGGTSGDWFDPANWANGAVPDRDNVSAVTIAAGTAVRFGTTPVAPAEAGPVSLTALAGNFGLNLVGGSLTVAGDLSLTSFQQSAGQLSVGNDFNVSGGFEQGTVGGINVGRNVLINAGTDLSLGNLAAVGSIDASSTGGRLTLVPATILSAGGALRLSPDPRQQNTGYFPQVLIAVPVVQVPVVTLAAAPVGLQVSAISAASPLQVASVPVTSADPNVLAFGRGLVINQANFNATPIRAMSVSAVSGFVPQRDQLVCAPVPGLEIKIDNTKGTISISGAAGPEDYQRAVKSLSLVGGDGAPLRLRVQVTDDQGKTYDTEVEISRRTDLAGGPN